MSDAGGVNDQQALATNDPAKSNRVDDEAASVAGEVTDQKPGNKMHVRVNSPYKVYYDGLAVSLSAENLTGPFDVLPHHHNFISLLTPCELVIRAEDDPKKTTRILISGGLLHVKADSVIVFLDV